MADVTSPWLTAREAAAHAKCSEKTITREARAGRLVGYRLARRRSWRFQASDVDAWLRQSLTPQLVRPRAS
jgi:excisionase family DNA binding protein